MQQSISYRDRDGFVVLKDRVIYRYVTHAYAPAYNWLMQSGLHEKLVTEGLLIDHAEGVLARDEQAYYRVLIPEIIHNISLPSEWTANQWKDIVLAFLKINTIAINYGMILKDATPFNFTFHEGRCVFFDTLSFELYEEGQPWIAYRQFCESMLGPMALIFFNDTAWSKLLGIAIEGWELPFISRNLPRKTWFNTTLLLHIHLHAKFRNNSRRKINNHTSFNKPKLVALWGMIQKSVAGWQYSRHPQHWVRYYDKEIASNTYINSKISIAIQWLEELTPSCVIDLGANNGRFSEIAALYSGEVIAIEMDHDCTDKIYLSTKEKNTKNIKTILADIAQPTPGAGWANEEKTSLINRLRGDMILALALIHHLCISRNVPLSFIAQLFANITTGYAIVEFVPKSDAKVQEMLQNREDIFHDYHEEEFISRFQAYFTLVHTHECGSSGRKIFLWKKRG